MTLIRALALTLCLASGAQANPVDVTFGGPGKDGVRKMVRTQDGGFVMVGWQDQKGIHDTGSGLIVAVDADGSERWRKTLTTTGRNQIATILERTDGTFVAVVEEYPTDADPGQVVLAELSKNGETLAVHHVGGPGSDVADSIQRTPDGGYVLAGESAATKGGSLDAWITKLSSTFEYEWEWRQGTPGRDRFNALIMLPDGAMIAAGNLTMPAPNEKHDEKAFVIKLDAGGGLLWSSTPLENQPASIRGLTQTADGGFIFAGFSKHMETRSFDAMVGKISADGVPLWNSSLSLDGGDYFHGVTKLKDGRYVAAGATRSADTGVDALVVEFDEDGGTITPKVFPRLGAQEVRAVQVLADESLVLAGANTAADSSDQQMWFKRIP